MFSMPLPHVTLVLAERCWGLSEARIQTLAGGMTSAVWAVDHGEGRWVVGLVYWKLCPWPRPARVRLRSGTRSSVRRAWVCGVVGSWRG